MVVWFPIMSVLKVTTETKMATGQFDYEQVVLQKFSHASR